MTARDGTIKNFPRSTNERQQDVIERYCVGNSLLTISEPFPSVAMPTHNGLDGLVRRIEGESVNTLVKTYHHEVLVPYTFSNAVEAHHRASEMGIGAAYIFADIATESILIQSLGNEWHTAKVSDFEKSIVVENWVNSTHQWHKEGTSQLELSAFDVFRYYVKMWQEQDVNLPFPTNAGITIEKMCDWMGLIEHSLDQVGYDKVVLHGENTVSNVMLTQDGKVKLVDFDRANIGDPFWDLAAMSLEICNDDHDRNELLEIYFGKASSSNLARLKLYTLVDDCVWSLWALLGEINTYRKGPELYKYAANRMIRLRHYLSTFDIAATIREV